MTIPLTIADPSTRAAATARLAAHVAGRPVVVGPVVLAGATPAVAWLREQGCPVLVLATAQGAGPVPEDCVVVRVDAPATPSVTEELRILDRLARTLPVETVAAIEAFDPERRAVWWGSPFVTTDEPILGRPVVAGRPRAFLDLEDKLLAEEVWAHAGVPRAAYDIVAVDDHASLARATERLRTTLGAVWSGDARDGFNGGGEFVRWVHDRRDATAAAAFFTLHCDRVRVQPFLDGVPCSIHGFVLPDGTAALRPVEIAMLRSPAERRFVYGGLGTWWDPPTADRDEMRDVVRRVGEHLREAHGYRGAFGVDGVLTADGFRPTELNTRASAGLSAVAEVDRWFFTLLQMALVNGWDAGVGVADVESLVPLMDAQRVGKVVAFGTGTTVREATLALGWDGTRFSVAADQSEPDRADNVLLTGHTPSGWFARIQPCSVLSQAGSRLAAVNVALMDLLQRELGTATGGLEMAPDVRLG